MLARYVFVLAAGCGFRAGTALVGSSAEGPIDAPIPDVAIDTRPDARPDAPPDARPDAPPDAPPDAFVPVVYVQGASNDPSANLSSVAAAYPSAQVAGHMNIVAIGWLDKGNAVTSVTDTAGNTYTQAAHLVNGVGQDIWYANGIAASASNTVTVMISGTTTQLDLRIGEYSGIAAANPIDQTVTAGGIGTAVASGNTGTTTYWHEMLVAASTVAFAQTAGDPTYTLRILTSNDGNILQDKEVTAVGMYNASATQNASGAWVITLLALRAAN